MKVNERMWVDPPQGYLYGFPKIYTPSEDGDFTKWMIKNGYPKEDLTSTTYCRYWPVEDGQH